MSPKFISLTQLVYSGKQKRVSNILSPKTCNQPGRRWCWSLQQARHPAAGEHLLLLSPSSVSKHRKIWLTAGAEGGAEAQEQRPWERSPAPKAAATATTQPLSSPAVSFPHQVSSSLLPLNLDASPSAFGYRTRQMRAGKS